MLKAWQRFIDTCSTVVACFLCFSDCRSVDWRVAIQAAIKLPLCIILTTIMLKKQKHDGGLSGSLMCELYVLLY